MKYRQLTSMVLLFSLLVGLWPHAVARAAEAEFTPPAPLRPNVGQAVRADTSPPLHELPPISPQSPLQPAPETGLQLPKAVVAEGNAEDPVVQRTHGPLAMPSPLTSFDGVSNVNGVLPPDTQGDIGYDPATGKKYYVQWVNLSFAIWDVTNDPVQVYGPVSGNTLWQGFGGVCETTNHGDPITLYDPLAQRWMISQFSINGPYYQCIAVSATADPTGAWHRYAFLVSNTKMNDYPHFGVWPDGYYMTVNQFTNGAYWGGAGVFVFERDKMLTGDPNASFQYFDLYSVNSGFGGMLPSDLDGSTLPPAGAPNYFLEVDDGSWMGPNDAIRIWEFHVDWNNPVNTTFGVNGQPNAILSTAEWTPICSGTRSCIPQPGTSSGLDAIGDRLMYRVAYRNFGTHEALVLNHTVNAGSGKAGVRWYEVRNPGGSPTIHQQGTFAPDGDNRWMGSIAMDRRGNMALGYTVASSSVYPSVRYTGRLAGDPLGTMPQEEVSLVAGGGSQTSSYYRWGDYSMMGVDPVDDCTFWYTQEYYATTSNSGWRTRIGSFRFPSCVAADTGGLEGGVHDADTGQGIAGAEVALKSGTGTSLSTIADDAGLYALVAPTGSYTVTAQAYGYTSEVVAPVDISPGVTTTLNFDLQPAEYYVISGTVTDADTGWPLFARLHVSGEPSGPPKDISTLWTDPVTGFYSLTLAADLVYEIEVQTWVDGYGSHLEALGPLSSNQTLNLSMQADKFICSAPGYQLQSALAHETDFNGGTLPAGWTVLDNEGEGAKWAFDNPGNRKNLTGGTGAFAIADSDFIGAVNVDTELRSPAYDFSGQSNVVLEFKYDFRWYQYGDNEVADVDVSVDGGQSWTNAWRAKDGDRRGPRTARLDISSLAAGEPDVRVRFRYYGAYYDWWWQVDDFFLGSFTCTAGTGGFVIGDVFDLNTGRPVDANLSSDAGATTVSRNSTLFAEDRSLYVLFSPTGTHVITATAANYGTLTVTKEIVANKVLVQDLYLPAGRLTAEPDALSFRVSLGLSATDVISLYNEGTFPADFDVAAINAPLYQPQTNGSFAAPVRRVSPKHMHDPDARTVRVYDPPDVPTLPAGNLIQSWTAGLTHPWGIAFDYATNDLWIGNIRWSESGDTFNYRYTAEGTFVGDVIDTSGWSAYFPADITYNSTTRSLWQVNVGSDNCIYELSTETLGATGRKLCPAFGVSQRGIAYDPTTDTFFSGSWSDQILYHFDARGRLLDSKDVALNIAGLAFNPGTGHLFVLSNAAIGHDVYVLDVRNEYEIVGGFDVAGLGDFQQAGLTIDNEGYLWAVNQETGKITQFTSGESGVLDWQTVDWLEVAPLTGTLAVGSEVGLAARVDTSGMSLGTYAVHLRISHATPYTTINVPVTLTVTSDYQVEVTPGESRIEGIPGKTVTHTLRVSNTGTKTDTYTIDSALSGWSTVHPFEVGPLTPGSEARVDVVVTVPPETACGESDRRAITVTSQAMPLSWAMVTVETVADAVYATSVSTLPTHLSGDPGTQVSTTFQVANAGNCIDMLDLDATSDWPISLSHDRIELVAGAAVSAVVSMTIPSGIPAGNGVQSRVSVTSLSDMSQVATAAFTTTANALPQAQLLPGNQEGSALPGETAVYTLTLSNVGNVTDTFTVTTSSALWPTVVQPGAMELGVGEEATLSVSVTVPAGTSAGVSDTATIVVTGSERSEVASVTTFAAPLSDVDLHAPVARKSGPVGTTVHYTLTLTNTGNVEDTFVITTTGQMWETIVAPLSATLASGLSATLGVSVTIPSGTLQVGVCDVVTVTALSQLFPASDAVTLTTCVSEEEERHELFLPLVLRGS